MAAYLIDHPPVRDQFYKTRNRPLTGCTVLHTAESVMDSVGPDTGAEAVAEFIRTRTTAGSYHDLADSDSYINVVPYESGAYHDGTGSNNWALSISWACGTHHWRQMTPERRRAFLNQGARAFVAQQKWRAAHGYPLTELRRITKAQSDAGMSGFIYHGDRDPARRTDPGKNPPDLFPFDEWIEACRAALAGTPFEEDDMAEYADQLNRIERYLTGFNGKDANGYQMTQFHYLMDLPWSRPFLCFRDDPNRGGSGTMVLAGQGRWVGIPSWGHFELYQQLGMVKGFADVDHVTFVHLSGVYTLPLADTDEAAIAEQLADLLPAQQAQDLADALREQAEETAKATADEIDRRAHDGDPATGPNS